MGVFIVRNPCIKSNHRCRNRSWCDEKLSKPKTAKHFATHFSISLHFASAGITVLRIDLQVTWTRANHHSLFTRRFSSFSLSLFLEISLFIFRHLHAEEISTANRPCRTFSPLPAKALQLPTFLKRSALPWRDLIGCSGVIILWVLWFFFFVPFL